MREFQMNISIHISFKGQCEEAFRYYEKHLGGVIDGLYKFKDTPASKTAPSEWQDKIVHGGVLIGNVEIAGADVVPEQYEQPKAFSLLLRLASESDVRSKFEVLADGGEVIMPPQKTFWSPCYAVVVDRFGVPWDLNSGT